MKTNTQGETAKNKKEISCRVTRTLLMLPIYLLSIITIG